MADLFDFCRRLGGTAQNVALKQMMEAVNLFEVLASSVIQADVTSPVRPLTEDDLARARWQYASQTRVQDTPARFWEFLPCVYGPGMIVLSQMLKAVSPVHLVGPDATLDGASNVLPDGQDPWSGGSAQEQADWVSTILNEAPPQTPALLLSFDGLAWFFASRMGCFYLQPWLDPETHIPGYKAEFDQLTRFELKPHMCEARKIALFFVATRTEEHSMHKLVLKRIQFGTSDTIIEDEQHPLFLKACRTTLMVAVSDATIRYHAVFSHALTGDVFTCATVRALPIGHAMRPLVEHLTHQVFNINNVLRMLVLAENGTAHTLFPYSWVGVQQYLADIYSTYSIWNDGWRPWARSVAHPCVGIVQDMGGIWDLLVGYVDDYLCAIGIYSDAGVLSDAPLCAWVTEVQLQQPNSASAGEVASLFAAHPFECVRRLLQMFFFHSVCTHDVSGATDRLLSSAFCIPTQLFATDAPLSATSAEQDRETHEELPGKQLTRRAQIASHSTAMVVPLLCQRWGDVMLPTVTCPPNMQAAKLVLNSLPTRLSALETIIRQRNKHRYFPTDSLFPTRLPCAICY